MVPTLNTTTSTPRRQSCDRCHGQKLRCTRSANQQTGACERCLRKGALCIYSSSLPKGRPSLYRLSEGPSGSKLPSPSKAMSASSSSTNSGVPSNEIPDTPEVTPMSPNMPPTPVRPDEQFGGTHTYSHASMDVQGGSYGLPPSMDAFSNIWVPWWEDDQIGDGMLGIVPSSVSSNLDPALEAQMRIGLGFSAHFPDSLESAPTESVNGAETGLEKYYVEDSSMGDSGFGGSNLALAAEKSGFELSIVHLSRLSTRLSQLLGSSRSFLAESTGPSPTHEKTESSQQLQHSIQAVFTSINTWLLHGSVDPNTNLSSQPGVNPANPIDLLHHMFSASNHLLDILRHLHTRVLPTSTTPSPSTTSVLHPQLSNSSSHTKLATEKEALGSRARTRTTSTSPSDPSHHSFSVVRHLLIVCVTLLLNMYVVILIALQRSADALNSLQLQNNMSQSVFDTPDIHSMNTGERVHLQMVTVVQLCSYFIRRQNQTLDVLISSSQGSELHNSHGSSSTVDELKTEVGERLRRLQKSLRIID